MRIGARNDRKREDAGDFLHRGAHGIFQAAFEMLLDQVRDDFGIGLGLEDVALVLKLVLEREIVLDDAIVDHDHVVLAIAMRMRVLFGRPSVSGPARMADAEGAIDRAHPDGFFQVAQLSLRAADYQLVVVAIDRETGRIVSPVLETFQAFQNDRNSPMRADVTDDATHNPLIIGAADIGSPSADAYSVQNLDAILFDDRVGEDFVGDGFDFAACLFGGDAVGECDLEVLALADLRDGGVAESIERGAHRLTLRIENGGLQSDEDASFHEVP